MVFEYFIFSYLLVGSYIAGARHGWNSEFSLVGFISMLSFGPFLLISYLIIKICDIIDDYIDIRGWLFYWFHKKKSIEDSPCVTVLQHNYLPNAKWLRRSLIKRIIKAKLEKEKEVE